MNAPINITDIRIETDRMILRPWQETDLADFYEYASVPGVGEMAGWNHHQSLEESDSILHLFIREKKTLALELKESGKVIGSLGLEEMDPDPMGEEKMGREIGYVLNKDYWGRGLMPEAVCAVICCCFDTLRYDYLTCGHFQMNSQSRRVIEKCGFSCFGSSDYQTQMGTTEKIQNYLITNPNK